MKKLKATLRGVVSHAVSRIPGQTEVPHLWTVAAPVLRKMAEIENTAWGQPEEQDLAQALRAFDRYHRITLFLGRVASAVRFRPRGNLDSPNFWHRAETHFATVGKQKVARHRPPVFAKSNRILFLTGVFPALRHGGGVRVFDIISELSQHYEVDLFATLESPEDLQTFEVLKKKLRRCHAVSARDFNVPSLLRWLSLQNESLDDYKIVHLEWHHTHVFLDELANAKCKVIFTLIENIHRAHFLRLRQFLESGQLVDAGRLLIELGEVLALEERLWKGADERIVVSDADGLSARALFGLDCHTVLTGISEVAILNDLKKAPARSESSGPSAGFVGYFTHPPNLEGMKWYLDKVHPLVLAKLPEFKMRVIGGGDTSNLRNVCGDEASVEFTGFVDNVVSEIQKNTICISPLISGAGLRGKLIQYSICGKASVSTTIGASGLPFIHQDSVLIADTPEDFAASMVALLTQPALRERIADAAKLTATSRLSWNSLIPKITALYDS